MNYVTRFPDLNTKESEPTLLRFNGCGLSFFGKRDYDPETRSYVITHYIYLLFIPLIPIGAYRVIEAKNGEWHILGKVPMTKKEISPERIGLCLAFGGLSMVAFCAAGVIITSFFHNH